MKKKLTPLEKTTILIKNNIDVIEVELIGYPINDIISMQTDNIEQFIKLIQDGSKGTPTIIYDTQSQLFFYFSKDTTIVLK